MKSEREEKFIENERKRKERLESTMRLGPHLYQEEVLATTVPLTDELKYVHERYPRMLELRFWPILTGCLWL